MIDANIEPWFDKSIAIFIISEDKLWNQGLGRKK